MCCSAIQCSVASCCRSISPLHVAVGIGDAAGLEHPIVIRSAGRESHGICVEQRDTDDEAGLTTVTSVDFKGNVLDKSPAGSRQRCARAQGVARRSRRDLAKQLATATTIGHAATSRQ